MLRRSVPGDAMDMGLADLLVVDEVSNAQRERAAPTHKSKNYGVDISILARLIEEGEI